MELSLREHLGHSQSSMIPEIRKVLSVHKDSADVFSIEIQGWKDREFQPGQFNMILVPGFGEIAISMSGTDRRRLIHTIRAVGPTTRALQKFKAGSEIGIRGPFGKPWPVEGSRNRSVVFVAGGIGLAPLRPAIEFCAAMAKERAGNGLTTHICYGARTPDDIIFKKDLARWKKTPGFRVSTTVDHANRGWKGSVGVVTGVLEKFWSDTEPPLVMTCGPEVMMRFVSDRLLDLGVNENEVYVSTERNMKCALGFCGHCQFGPHFICKDGPVFPLSKIHPLLRVREL